MATKNDRIPRTTTASPTKNSAFIGSLQTANWVHGPERPPVVSDADGGRRDVSPLAIGKVPSELHQAAERDSRGTFGNPRLLLLGPGGARDIEMQPGGLLGELFEEHGRRDGATP